MSKLKWITPKSLGIVEEKSYFEIQLSAQSDSPDISYMLISGTLPQGVVFSDSGLLSGRPNTFVSGQKESDTVVDFTVRAWDQAGTIADKTFNFIVSAVVSVGILSESEFLGTFLDGDRFEHQIKFENFGQNRPTAWRITSGRIPEGLAVDSNGRIRGFLGNKINQGPYGWDNSSWDSYFLDPTRPQHASVYEFTVEVDDGIYQNRKSYKIEVLPRDYVVRADRTYQIPYDYSKLEASQNGHLPTIIEETRSLPQVKIDVTRHDTNFAFKFNAKDLDNDEFYYEITSPDEGGFDQDNEIGFDQDVFDSSDYPMPVGIGLNNQSGWYTGHFFRQRQTISNHIFQIYARKKWGRDYSGPRTSFNVTTLGNYTNKIYWVTDSDLGIINNGSFSDFKIEAKVDDKTTKLYYKLKSSIPSRTPQGLVLLSSGELSGRVSFRYFSLDRTNLTLDKDQTTFDRQHTFTVVTHDIYYAYYSEKTFTLTVNVLYKSPYDMLYLRALPNKAQRKFLKSIIENEYYFPNQLLYRPADPFWGKKSYLEFLFQTGLEPGDLETYLPAIAKNHYTKTFTFGEIKTASAVDNEYNIIYEVVYLEIIDSQLGVNSKTGLKKYPEQSIVLSKLNNFYSVGGVDQKVLNPNGLGNMKKQIADNIQIDESSPLPRWMTSMQPNLNSVSGFDPPLGYVPAVVLAYTEPGGSKAIAYRINSSGISFNNIEFTSDRYLLDNVLSKNYNIHLKEFIPSQPCYFDQIPSVAEYYRKKPNVDWAIVGTYSQVSGQLVSDLIDKNIFDGRSDFADGDTVILIQNSNYVGINDYSEGWVDDRYDSRIIPGYLDKVLTGVDDERSGIYQIYIDMSGYLFLDLMTVSQSGDVIKIKKGKIYGGKTLCLDSYLILGTDPTWREFKYSLTSNNIGESQLVKNRTTTTFDSNATRFISHRDQYYVDPNIEDKYIKFPKTGVFI